MTNPAPPALDHATWAIGELQLLKQKEALEKHIADLARKNEQALFPHITLPLMDELDVMLTGLNMTLRDWRKLPHSQPTWWSNTKVKLYRWATESSIQEQER